MKYIKISALFFVAIVSLSFLLSCSKMNDVHEVYMKDGEIIYVGRVDSAHAFPGKNRMLINYWMSDPRVKQLIVYWNSKKDSIIVDVPKHAVKDSVEFYIGSKEKPIEQGSYTLEFYSTDGGKSRSIAYEIPVNIYGEDFTETLLNRLIKESTFDHHNSDLLIQFYAAFAKTEVAVELNYTDKENVQVTSLFKTEEIESANNKVVLKNVKTAAPISYRTLYLPESKSIDTFYTDKSFIELK
ncbi:DUF4998 domain-containing protein [Sphingobacterium sp. UT-1RO-CII-1]|uniref:DUF4998 domain-containing protein n=1 Tax=Sphingobacterium sp. UT-1RO-CII-1 TaxID=2995225 RepID=UPI00227A7107|nr:DUF4998 domain-containing protein [Sphingobacterium sp. UT-1RO-CII-1]MCY4779230.1 DUF4998 domain-containing protein [Sphingobacterium sp. UT-1RO-CII-1]